MDNIFSRRLAEVDAEIRGGRIKYRRIAQIFSQRDAEKITSIFEFSSIRSKRKKGNILDNLFIIINYLQLCEWTLLMVKS